MNKINFLMNIIFGLMLASVIFILIELFVPDGKELYVVSFSEDGKTYGQEFYIDAEKGFVFDCKFYSDFRYLKVKKYGK